MNSSECLSVVIIFECVCSEVALKGREALTSEVGGGGQEEETTRNRPNDFVQRSRCCALFACFL